MQTPIVIRRAMTRLRGRKPRPLILMYHRITQVRYDPWGIAVHPDHFEQQVAHLRRHRTIMSMDQLIDGLKTKNLPADAVALTFDDGYRDNLINAKPILSKYDVPAYLFLPTGYVDSETRFWWDELADMTLGYSGSVDHNMTWGSQAISIKWPKTDCLSSESASWRAWNRPITARQSCYLSIWQTLQRATQTSRQAAMNTLRSLLPSPVDPLSLPMTSDEIAHHLRGGLITLGAHSITHAALTTLTRPERVFEINESRETCRSMTCRLPSGFAYPYGDMDAEVQADVMAAGFSWACSTQGSDLTDEGMNLFALPRLNATDVPASVFASLLTT